MTIQNRLDPLGHIRVTPSLLSMRVIAKTKEAIYLRLPRELQRPANCGCKYCLANPSLSKWDTLVVPMKPNEHSYTVHMPDPSVADFVEYCRRKKL